MRMPRRIKVLDHLKEEEIEERYKSSRQVKERTHWQVILLVCQGRPVDEVARIVSYTPNWVRLLVGRYNRLGPQSLGDQRGQAGGHNTLWNEALRAQLAQVLEQSVPDELGGGVWNGVKVALWLETKLGRPVHRQRGQEGLRALGFSCQVPRPRHVLADQEEQEAFKKSWRRA